MYEGLLESEGAALFGEVERQDSRIQREITAAEMERKWFDYARITRFRTDDCTILS